MFTDSEELKKHAKPQLTELLYDFRDVSAITNEELERLKQMMLQQMAIKQQHLYEDLENVLGSLDHKEREPQQETFTIVLPKLNTDVH